MSEWYPDMSEPVVGLVVPEKEIHGGNVFDSLLALVQITFDMLEKIINTFVLPTEKCKLMALISVVVYLCMSLYTHKIRQQFYHRKKKFFLICNEVSPCRTTACTRVPSCWAFRARRCWWTCRSWWRPCPWWTWPLQLSHCRSRRQCPTLNCLFESIIWIKIDITLNNSFL